MTDSELLSAYVATRSQDAFRQLVDRHLPLVYASALRQLRDPHLAEDAAQAVFLVLIKKAPALRTTTILPAWLLTTTRYVCRDARKLARRRQLHEQKAAAMNPSTSMPSISDETSIAGHLDDALATLSDADRALIVLRYFNTLAIKDVGSALQISENATHKRLERALQKLRAFFAGRNITLSLTALPIALAAHAPVPLAPALVSTIASVQASAAASHTALSLTHSALRALFWTPPKIAAAIAALIAATTLIAASAAASMHAAPPVARSAFIATAAPFSQPKPNTTTQGEAELPVNGQFAAKIEDLLGIKDTGADVLPLIADAVKADDADMATKADAYNKLVDGLLAGPHPTVLLNKIMDAVDRDFTDFAQERAVGWQWGTEIQRQRLISSLWNLAQEAQRTNPQRASDIARASLLLSALNDFRLVGTLGRPLNTTKREAIRKLLSLPDAQFNQLVAIMEKYAAESGKAFDIYQTGLRGIDAINKSPNAPTSKSAVEAILKRLDEGYRNATANNGDRRDIICGAWDLLNLTRLRGFPEGEAVVRKQLETWKQGFPDEHLVNWINQALIRTEPTVHEEVADFVMQPNGKIVPKPTTVPTTASP